MEKSTRLTKKETLFVVGVIASIIAVLVAGIKVMQFREAQWEEQLEYKRHHAYQNWVFYISDDLVDNFVGDARFGYLPFVNDQPQRLYLDLAVFTKCTGETLTFSEIEDYFSQEYEDDGSVRIYTNGRHPEINAFVEWRRSDTQEVREEIDAYEDTLFSLLRDYEKENYEDKGLKSPIPLILYDLTIAQLDELIKKEADPNYEMQLAFE